MADEYGVLKINFHEKGFFCSPKPDKRKKSCCIKTTVPPKKPDPAIYSQQELLSQGIMPRFDSPDITTTKWGGDFETSELLESTLVKVRNKSGSVPAINTLVNVEYSGAGIGLPRFPLGSQVVSLSPGEEIELKFAVLQSIRDEWDTYSVFVTLSHPHDNNALNNWGEQNFNTQKGEAGQANDFHFKVHNRLPGNQNFQLIVANNDWPVALSMNSTGVMLPGENRDVVATVTPAAGMNGTTMFDVLALTQSGALYGGAAFHLRM